MKNRKILSFTLSLFLLFALIIPSGAAELKAGDSVYIGGMPFGVRFFTGNMTVSGFTEVDGETGNVSPAYDAGMREKDVILKIDNKDIKTAEEVTRAVENSDGKTLLFQCNRDGRNITFEVKPAKSLSAGAYKIGIWIKDSTSGIGTVTFVDKKTGFFGGLGHGICSSETGDLVSIRRGVVCNVKISGIEKGKNGTPGELRGYFSSGKTGVVTVNCDNGVFGIFSSFTPNEKYNAPLPIASRKETKSGDASILCTLSDNTISEFDIKIDTDTLDSTSKSFIISVTDPKLLEATGGIVQGMSGSPIIQDGKLIGAVTHVLVNDPTRGYGIFIENMLEAARQVADEQANKNSS